MDSLITREIESNIKGGLGLFNSVSRGASSAIGGAIVGGMILAYLHVKAANLVWKQLRAHPYNAPLLIAIGSCIVFLILFAVSLATGNSSSLTYALLFELCFWLTFAVALVVSVYYDRLLRAQFTRGQLVDQVLHQPWWDAA